MRPTGPAVAWRVVHRGTDPGSHRRSGAHHTVSVTPFGQEQVLHAMEEHRIRRLPVIDEHRLVGMITEADLARHLPEGSWGTS